MAIDLDVHGNTKPLEAAVQAAVNRIRRKPIKITVDDKGATQPLGNMKRAADEFSKSMEAANARILAFGASMAIINGVSDAFKGMVRNLVEVEKSLADINVVMGLSNQNIEKFGDGLFKVAKETGAAFRVAADAATEYARQGLAVEETLKRTRDALVLTRLTGMDSAEAVKSLTAAMNTYGNQIKDTTQLVSKFAAVDVQFAVSAEDFAAAISRTGQAAKSAGVDIDELIGIVTSAQQQTARGGAVIGNALKTIFTKTGRTDTLNQLENLGIAVRDLEGNTIGAKRILTELANTFDKLSEAQKAQITQTMGGLFHINILKAVLSDAAKQNGILANATQISANATDEAIQKNEQLRQTMSAMATETGLAVKQLSVQIGELMLAPGMEKILNAVKSIAEGAGDLLGDGESAGSRFANGFLKGLGNVITGPGLIVITTVFVKLFATAVKFTKESLTSLIGVTSEAQKQKAIQTSLVALIGQNAALGKEMLRTDISRTEKEKILLGLLRMQTAEATRLNDISKQLASTLYTRGYGPGLTQGKRRAYGHIPNFADPERAQAAKGGYAAGSIRSMNMPGEGSVIYNSAETVKNFAGFKQPAIMPPQSSKAGKNYQQAFGSIHGFDPYAAGGFVPNFNKRSGKKLGTAPTPRNLQSKKLGTLNADSSLILLTADSSAADGENNWFVGQNPQGETKVYDSSELASKRTTGYYKVDVPYYSIDKKDKTQAGKEDLPAIQKAIRGAAVNKALDIATAIVGGKKNLRPYNKEQIEKTFNDGAFKAAAGSTFESAIAAALKSHLFQDYQARTDTSAIDLPYDPRLFGYFGAPNGYGKMGAEVKADLASKLQKGAANKFYQVLTGARAAWEYKDKDYKDKTGGRAAYAGLERRGSGYFKKRKAYGHIPNFADPLSDAIGREKAAGVPVSQIRVGSHSALMSKGNPLGLGVTNTYDEPNGLRDVFGASGFVPNYATQGFAASDFISGNSSKQAKEANRKLKMLTDAFENGRLSQENLNKGIKNITAKYNLSSRVTDRVVASSNENIKVTSRLNAARKRVTRSMSRGVGRIAGGMGGGMASLAIGQMSGFVESPRLSGAMQSASSGAMIGSMLSPVLGPLAPFGTLIGTAAGALYGFVSATEDATKAQIEAGKEMGQSILSTPIAMQAFKSIGSQEMQRLANLEEVLQAKLPESEAGKKIAASQSRTQAISQSPYGYMGGVATSGAIFAAGQSEQEIKADFIEDTSKDAFTERKAALIKALKTLDPSTSFMGKGLKDGKEKQFTTETFISEIDKLDLTKVEDREALKQAIQNGLTLQQKLNVEAENERKAVILRLNAQRAMLEAQQQAKSTQLDIKSSYSQINNSLSGQLKIMGRFATEQQKAQINYTKSINKAAEAYASGAQAEESKYREGMIGLTKDAGISSGLKSSLAKNLGITADEIDLTEELIKLSNEELHTELKKLELTEPQRQALEDLKNGKIKNIELLLKELQISGEIAENEFRINDAIARRKDILSNMKFAGEMRGQVVGHEQAMRGLRSQVGAAQRLTAIGPGYQTREAQENFQINEKRIELENKIKTINENKETQLIKEREKMAGILLDNQKLLELKKKQEDFTYATKYHEGRMSDGSKAEFSTAEQSEMNALIANQGEREKQLIKIENAQSNINEKAKEEISTAEKLLELEEERIKAKRAHETGPGAFGRGLGEGFERMREQAELFDYEFSQKIPGALADGLATAMSEGLSGAKSIGDALRDAGLGFLQMIQQAMMQKAAMNIVSLLPFSQGGNVRRYNQGGSVPAMVSNGEYVMGRDAVNKYGGAFMHRLNAAGNIPGYSTGGKLEGVQYKSGKAYQKKRMSGAFYGRADNVGLQEDASLLQQALADKRAKQEEAVAKAFQEAEEDNARVNQIVGAVAGIAIAGITAGMTAKFGQKNPKILAEKGIPSGSVDYLVKNNPGMSRVHAEMLLSNAKNGLPGVDLNHYIPAGSPYSPGDLLGPPRYYGGPIRKYASGGYISGKSGIDQIPAMLSEGEYVIRASSARQIGKPMLDRINAGKFNDGGPVDQIAGSEETSGTSGNTNNINISVNIESGSVKGEQKSFGDSSDGANVPAEDRESGMAIAEKIKQQVLAVIVEEQRPGGLLRV